MFCTSCGAQNADAARFCQVCGRPQLASSQPNYVPANTVPSSLSTDTQAARGMRIATLVLGLIAASVLLFGGCSAYFVGGTFEAFEDSFGVELDDPGEGITSTTEDVSSAGGAAIFVAIFLFIAAGLAIAALKTSLTMLVLTLPMLFGLVAVDTTSLFASAYYLAIIVVVVGIILMAVSYFRLKNVARN